MAPSSEPLPNLPARLAALFPQVRLLALCELGIHALLHGLVKPYATGEAPMARALTRHLGPSQRDLSFTGTLRVVRMRLPGSATATDLEAWYRALRAAVGTQWLRPRQGRINPRVIEGGRAKFPRSGYPGVGRTFMPSYAEGVASASALRMQRLQRGLQGGPVESQGARSTATLGWRMERRWRKESPGGGYAVGAGRRLPKSGGAPFQSAILTPIRWPT